jgi:hypothetical protein
MKLLAKTAEERYQTAAAVVSDLQRCLSELEFQGSINEFRLGEHDVPDRLLIPEKLYGRTSEIDSLVASFERVVAGGRPELVLVSGIFWNWEVLCCERAPQGSGSASRPFRFG